MKELKVFVNGVETNNYKLIGNAILLPSKFKSGLFWSVISKIPFLRKYAYDSEQLITIIYEAGQQSERSTYEHDESFDNRADEH